MQSVAHTFLELLERSQLLQHDRIVDVVQHSGLREEATAAEMAEAFVGQGALTQFQAERLLQGRYRGLLVSQFRLLEPLGIGGMGAIYVAQEPGRPEKVALKVLAERFGTDAAMVARFQLEARAGARLAHPNIIRMGDIGEAGTLHYYCMELFEAVNLHELVEKQGPLPFGQACDIIRQAAAGLQHVHTAGLVHRDIKPANLLVNCSGQVKIADFGLAMLDQDGQDDEFSLAMIFGHTCVGTAEFIAPEQSLNSFTVDHRADLYSLGCTLFAALTARIPYPGKTGKERMEAHRSAEIPSVLKYVPDLPPEVAEIVRKLMAKDPADRFQSAAEVVDALTPFSEARPVEFDFERLLAIRSADARQRLSSLSRSGTSRASGMNRTSSAGSLATLGSSPRTASPPDTMTPQAACEDTEPESSHPRRKAIALPPSVHLSEIGQVIEQPDSLAADPSAAWLIPAEGENPILLTGTRVTIGRDADCQVHIPSNKVSGKHCELRFEGSLWRVVDLNSKNGVHVNGVATTEHTLHSGDRLTVAHQFRYHIRYQSATGGKFPWWLVAAVVAAAGTIGGLTWVWLG